jgi:hypothetical protein
MVAGPDIAPRPGKFSSNDSFDDLDKLDASLNQKSVPTPAEQTARNANAKWALKLLDDFSARPSSSPYWLYPRRDVVAQLKERVNDPTKINQADTWLCGVTSVVRAWAQDTPVDYAWLGIQLYDLGRGRLGKGELLGKVVSPSADLRRSGLPDRMKPADWMILASVHEACNIAGVRDYTKDEGPLHYKAWQYAREVVAAYKAAGYKNVVDHTDNLHASNFDVADLEQANTYLRQGYRVSLLINDRLLSDKQIGTQAFVATSDHWIGMLETINVTGDYIQAFNVFSWGQRRKVPQFKDRMMVQDFLKEFYGFVAARMY